MVSSWIKELTHLKIKINKQVSEFSKSIWLRMKKNGELSKLTCELTRDGKMDWTCRIDPYILQFLAGWIDIFNLQKNFNSFNQRSKASLALKSLFFFIFFLSTQRTQHLGLLLAHAHLPQESVILHPPQKKESITIMSPCLWESKT